MTTTPSIKPALRVMFGIVVAAFGANLAHVALHPVNERAVQIGAVIFAAGVFLVTPDDAIRFLKAIRTFVPWAKADAPDGPTAPPAGDAK